MVETENNPRAFNLDPEGRFLMVAGRLSGRLATYRIDTDSDGLSPLDVYDLGDRPMWVEVV